MAPRPPPLTTFIRVFLTEHFYQWANNNGYCGEVDLIQAGLNNGQWMSQYDARLVCCSGLGQAGTCSKSSQGRYDQAGKYVSLLVTNPRRAGQTGKELRFLHGAIK